MTRNPAPPLPGDGFYHVSFEAPGSPTQKKALQLADLKAARLAGLKVMHFSHLQDVAHTWHLLDVAHAFGMVVMLEDVPASQRADLRHPALLALSVVDDANRKPLGQVIAACAIPEATCTSVGPGLHHDCAEYFGHSTYITGQFYPLPHEDLQGIITVMRRSDALARASGTRLIPALGCHPNGGDRLPTAAEVRALRWLAQMIIPGGALWYAQQDQGGSRITRTLFSAIRSVAGEVRAITGGQPGQITQSGVVLTGVYTGGTVRVDLEKTRASVKRGAA